MADEQRIVSLGTTLGSLRRVVDELSALNLGESPSLESFAGFLEKNLERIDRIEVPPPGTPDPGTVEELLEHSYRYTDSDGLVDQQGNWGEEENRTIKRMADTISQRYDDLRFISAIANGQSQRKGTPKRSWDRPDEGMSANEVDEHILHLVAGGEEMLHDFVYSANMLTLGLLRTRDYEDMDQAARDAANMTVDATIAMAQEIRDELLNRTSPNITKGE